MFKSRVIFLFWLHVENFWLHSIHIKSTSVSSFLVSNYQLFVFKCPWKVCSSYATDSNIKKRETASNKSCFKQIQTICDLRQLILQRTRNFHKSLHQAEFLFRHVQESFYFSFSFISKTLPEAQRTRDVRGGERVKIRGAGQRWKSAGWTGAQKRVNWLIPKILQKCVNLKYNITYTKLTRLPHLLSNAS